MGRKSLHVYITLLLFSSFVLLVLTNTSLRRLFDPYQLASFIPLPLGGVKAHLKFGGNFGPPNFVCGVLLK